jgi:hypothetical protein
MVDRLFSHLRGNLVAYAALFIALSGTALAAADVLPANSVGTAQLKNGAVTGQKVAHNTLTGANVKASTLGTVPNATHLAGLLGSAYQRRIGTACSNGKAVQSVSVSGAPTCRATNVTQVLGSSGSATISSSGAALAPEGVSSPMSIAGSQVGTSALPSTAKNLFVKISTAPPLGTAWQFGFALNGVVQTAVQCSIQSPVTTCSDTTHSMALPAGSQVALVVFAAGSPPPITVTFGWTDVT